MQEEQNKRVYELLSRPDLEEYLELQTGLLSRFTPAQNHRIYTVIDEIITPVHKRPDYIKQAIDTGLDMGMSPEETLYRLKVVFGVSLDYVRAHYS